MKAIDNIDISSITNSGITLTESTAPIVVIGAGKIVQDAHLVAYKIAGFTVKGIYDQDFLKAEAVALRFNIPEVYRSIQELVEKNGQNVIYDVAVPGFAITEILVELPDYCSVLLQKPMGENIDQARHILNICEQKQLSAGVNFQLRYAPYILMLKQMISVGALGDICDLEIHLNVFTPWNLWDFLFSAPRVEILYHSIHYIDLIRNLIGNPDGIFAKTTKHPQMENLHSVKSNIIMDYGDFLQANIFTNHVHDFGPEKQDSYFKVEGTKGAVKIQLGLNMDYPKGSNDKFEYILKNHGGDCLWQELPIIGSWFPHGFIGSMNQMMQNKNNRLLQLDNSVQDCFATMVCVEKAYQSFVPAINWEI